jgi:hypothetical protein
LHIGEPTPAAAADLATFSARGTRLIGRPLMGRSFFVRGAPAFAGYFALLFGGHRRKATAFLSNSVHSCLLISP